MMQNASGLALAFFVERGGEGVKVGIYYPCLLPFRPVCILPINIPPDRWSLKTVLLRR